MPTESTDEAERFRVACRTYEITLPEQRQIQAATHRNFLFYVACSFFMAMWGLVFAPGMRWLPASLVPGLGLLAALAPSLLLGLLAARASLTNWQLRTRRLGTFREWACTPAAWWTSPPSEGGPGAGEVPYRRPSARDPEQSPIPLARQGRSTLSTVLWATVAAAWALMPLAAYANTAAPDLSGLFGAINTSQDTAYTTVQRIFPPLFGSAGDTFLSAAFQTFNASLLLVASFILSWHTVAGMVSAAHEGRLVGNKYHMIWAPVRVTAGIGMLAPVNGYCTAQMLLVQIWLLGFGMANTVWTATVQAVVDPKGNTSVAFVPPSDNAKNVLKSILAAEVCAATIRAHPQGNLEVSRGVRIVPASGPDLQGRQVFTETTTADGFASVGTSLSGVQWDYGPVCGTLTLPYPSGGSANEAAERAFSDAVSAAVRTMIGNTRSAVSAAAAAIVAHAGQTQANPGQQPMTLEQAKALIGPIIDREAGAFVASVRNAATAYWNTVDRQRRNAFVSEASSKGWASAGVFYMTISRMSAQVIEKSNVTLTVRGVDPGAACPGWVGRRLGQVDGCDVGKAAGVTSKFLNDAWDKVVTDSISAYDADSVTAGSDGFSGLMGSVFGPLSRELLQMNALNPAKPLESMVERGHWTLGIATAGLVAFTAAHAVSSGAQGQIVGKKWDLLTGGISAIRGALTALSPVLLLMLGAIFMYGIMNAYVLPMMPFIMWAFAVGSVVILFIESVVAASVWAFVHVRMDGQEFADGAQRAGYMLAFNAFMRPTLSIFGLILGMAAFSATTGFVDQSFPYAFQGAMANHFVFIVGWIVSIFMMLWLQWHFALRSFSMCHMLPDRVAAWMGASGANMGEEGEFSAAKGALMSAGSAYGVGSIQAASQGIGRAAQMKQSAQQAGVAQDQAKFDNAIQIHSQKSSGVDTTALENRFKQKYSQSYDSYLKDYDPNVGSGGGSGSISGGSGGGGGATSGSARTGGEPD